MGKWSWCKLVAISLLLLVRADDNNNDILDDDSEELEYPPDPKETYGQYTTTSEKTTKALPKNSLQCYSCAYDRRSPQRDCLDPIKYNVSLMACPSEQDKCFTSTKPTRTSNAKTVRYEYVVRGCRTVCLGPPAMVCCNEHRCNNQTFAPTRKSLSTHDNGSKSLPSTVVYFVTVLLVLHTVVRVAFV